jgi:enediyne biosynthesis protein E4
MKPFKSGILLALCIGFFFQHCSLKEDGAYAFEVLEQERTGIDFNNKLIASPEFNMLKYMYFYNGAGVGAGDFNNDGLTDLFFSSNQGQNKLYLNRGKFRFVDVTEAAKIPGDGGWSTGVSIVDLNNDGLLDIYVCRVGKYEKLNNHNLLLVCKGIDKNGVPFYEDESAKYRLNFSGFSTQAAFFDYDLDGDLDMYLLNHSLRYNSTFSTRSHYADSYDSVSLSGDRLYRNDGEIFRDVTREAMINSSEIGYGLGVVVADINLDGHPDIYVGNDFHENDYLYINQKNGRFKEELTEHIMHTSQFSMGVDVGDINNDGYPDIISMDMLPDDPEILKRSLGEDEYNTFRYKINNGYYYQYTRNNLQLNRRNGMFSELGMYAGVYATDWSWAALFMDFDNDGRKDLFVSNGIPKRLNDIDYVNYVSNQEIQQKIRNNQMGEKDLALINNFPEIKLSNRFFHNDGDAMFSDIGKKIRNDKTTFSNGAICADLDNDGDLDVVTNDIDAPALVYQNKLNDEKPSAFFEFRLLGPDKNRNAIGAKVVVFAGKEIRTYEKNPVRGFMSSMELPIHAGIDNSKIDSVLLIWPDNTYQSVAWKQNSMIDVRYEPGLPKYNYEAFGAHWVNSSRSMEDLTGKVKLNHLHVENPFNEFDREALIPHMVSREGPALAVGDLNADGRVDIFIGSSKGNKSAVFVQEITGRFRKTDQPALDIDSTYEDVDACWVDVNNDHLMDLVIASGGNEYYGRDEFLSPRIYMNEGNGKLRKSLIAFDSIFLNASCVSAADFNGDGNVDLFIGGRTVPWEYGQIPKSYLFQNNGKGKFVDVTSNLSQELGSIGMVTSASWTDMDRDGDQDLVVSLEWGGIVAMLNEGKKFSSKHLTSSKGWWNFALPCDIDKDGDIDFIAGNLGLNSRIKASVKEPVRLYYSDFDENDKREQILTYYLLGREIPFANKDELQKQLPSLKKKFLYAGDFAKASLKELIGPANLQKAEVLSADYLANAVLINEGNFNFSVKSLPWEAQLSSYRDAVVVDANKDDLPDILLVGNFYENNIQMGRYDPDFGTILLNRGGGQFHCETLNGVAVRGETRHIRRLNIGGREAFVLARNNDSTMVIGFK